MSHQQTALVRIGQELLSLASRAIVRWWRRHVHLGPQCRIGHKKTILSGTTNTYYCPDCLINAHREQALRLRGGAA